MENERDRDHRATVLHRAGGDMHLSRDLRGLTEEGHQQWPEGSFQPRCLEKGDLGRGGRGGRSDHLGRGRYSEARSRGFRVLLNEPCSVIKYT